MSSSKPQSDRIDAALVEYFERVDAGEVVDVNEFMLKHADIADQLASFLNDNQSVERAMDASKTAHFSHSDRPSASKGLRIACPHCSNHVELLVDTPYESVTCRSCGSAFSLVDREEATRMAAPLKSIGRFDLISRLGVGGFGSVWKAHDRELDRTVAVKIPRKGQLSTDEIEQFFREARSAAQLKHPNIVPVHEVGRDGDTIFIVCDLVRGVELSDWLTASRATFRESVELCRTIARALHHAHQSGIVHRDLKPSNIMIDGDGEPHLMDFGLAKREIGEITMTVDGQILGTPAYMSPEQASGHSHWTDRRTDIYSLGVIFYRMLTGELPFRGNAQMQVFQRLKEDPPSPRKLNRHIPRDLETICLKCLERDPNNRYPSANALADEFDRFLSSMPIMARPLSKVERTLRWTKRKPAMASFFAALAVLAVGGPTLAIKFERQRDIANSALAENATLVKTLEREKAAAITDAAEKERRLKLWEGRANLHEAWLPDPANPPRRQQLAALLDNRGDRLAPPSGDESLLDQSQRLLALAVLNEGAGRRDESVRCFADASEAIQKLLLAKPDSNRLNLALAECYERLADLTATDDGEASKEWLAKEMAVHRRLADGARNDALSQAFRLDAEVRSDVLTGFDEQDATALERLSNELNASWPVQPTEIYRIACFVAGRIPWLNENISDSILAPTASSD